MLNRLTLIVRTGFVLTMAFLTLAGCGLFNRTSDTATSPDVVQNVKFSDVVTAEAIGERNAPVNKTDSFTTEQDRIYVVAQAEELDPGTTIFARWSRDGQAFEDSPELTANQAYQDTYVEFHLEPVSGSFDPGQYSVQLFVNGNPSEQASFTVR